MKHGGRVPSAPEPAADDTARPRAAGARAAGARENTHATRIKRLLVAALLLCCAAPTAGDIGSCGQDPEELDALKFFSQKGGIDRSRCSECGIESARCQARQAGELEATEFPTDCFPLVHDGEVCLHALLEAGCDDYQAYMRDVGATVPTECNFCPPRAGGAGGAP